MNEPRRRTVGGVANDDPLMLAGTCDVQVGASADPGTRLVNRVVLLATVHKSSSALTASISASTAVGTAI